MHAADVKSVFRAYSIDVAAREKDDLKEDPIIVRLRKVFVPNSHLSLSQDLTPLFRPEVRATTGCNNMLSRYISKYSIATQIPPYQLS